MIQKDATFIYNYTGKYLAGKEPGDAISEAWRFPLVLPYYAQGEADYHHFNEVTFIYIIPTGTQAPFQVALAGSFSGMQTPLILSRVESSKYFYISLKLPKGKLYTYKFLVNGQPVLDQVNPQMYKSPSGETFSRFFTDYCTQPLCFERWEMDIIERFATHILPFRTRDGQRFLDYYFYHLDSAKKEYDLPRAYRLDQTVGVTNFIDKLLAKEEGHRLIDYKICLDIIRRLFKTIFPLRTPREVPMQAYIDLYNQMGNGNVPGWDYMAYGSPSFFLQILRRHVFTGAFAHPKYGGNSEAAGWEYLHEQKLLDGNSLFNWKLAIEKPIGQNAEYLG